jgi:SAM-dependent methyltransferase
MAVDEELIDVRQLMSEMSIKELNELAEQYFARLTNWDYHLARPFGTLHEAPQLLINFAVVLQGLALCQGMTVLEFGAGTGWASRFLTQLGCHVIATDVSRTALRIGQELYARLPPVGEKPAPVFLPFDGERLELPDESVDRIMCLDAFHHVPNPAAVLKELSRVLVNGGIAGFAEPGPYHSRSAQSQCEMKTFKVIENDVNIQDIWRDAQHAGFTEMKLAVFNVPPVHLKLDEFEAFLSDDGDVSRRCTQMVRDFLQNERNFFLYKGETNKPDSRYREGLTAKIAVAPAHLTVKEGEPISVRATITNNSSSVWLPRSSGMGAVHLGCHLYDRNGNILRHSHHWEPLTPDDGREIVPDETIEVAAIIPTPAAGEYLLEFDMVSNDVCWFALNGSQQPHVSLEVRAG